MKPLSTVERVLLFITVSLATFMIVLDYSIANISIPYIAGDLAVSNDQATYVITSFAVGNAIGLLLTGWLSKTVGQVKLVTLSVILFTVFSWACGLSISLTMLVISRFIQGLVAGPMIPLSQSLLLSYGTPQSRSRDLAIWTTIIVTAPVIGPILGGYISDYYRWSWIFYINIPVGIICSAIFWFLLRRRETKTEKAPTDIPGILLLSLGVACLQIFLDKGQDWDWWNSTLIRLLFVGTVISFTFFIIRQIWARTPLIPLRLFKIPSYSLSIICLMVSYAIYFGTVVIVPLWLQEYMGYTPEWAGVAVSAVGIAPVFLSMLTPKMISRFGSVGTLLISFVLFGAASFYSAFFTTAVDLPHIAFARFFFGLGLVCYFNALVNTSVQNITMLDMPHATGIFHFVRAMVGGIGTSVFTTIWLRRTIFHHERIGSYITPSNPLTPNITDPQALALLNDSMDQQAALLSINDSFWVMGWCFVGLVLLLTVWLLFKKKSAPVIDSSASIAH
jgi:MFS transporter, DHA2 family, multidrug resistance protein